MKAFSVRHCVLFLSCCAAMILSHASFAQDKTDFALPLSVGFLESRPFSKGVIRLLAHSDRFAHPSPPDIGTSEFLQLEWWNPERTQLIAQMDVKNNSAQQKTPWFFKNMRIIHIYSLYADDEQVSFSIQLLSSEDNSVQTTEADCTVAINGQSFAPAICEQMVYQ